MIQSNTGGIPVKEKILDEMCQLLDKQPMTKDDISILGELADALKDVSTATGMDMYGEKYLMPDGSYAIKMPHVSYGGPMMDDSYRRGRSPSTGRYVSMAERPRYEGGYSGHSINDKMIASLEKLMDKAESEYERQQIADEINDLRSRM